MHDYESSTRRSLVVLSRLTLVILFIIGVAACNNSVAQYRDIDVDEAAKLIDQPNTLLLDVRTPEEYAEARIAGATLIPVDELSSRIGELAQAKDKEVIVYCRSGSRSARASELLTEKGFKVANVTGGINAWRASGKPVESGPTK